MNKLAFIFYLALLTVVNLKAQQQTTKAQEPPKKTMAVSDTVKCYVEVMVPASDAIGLHRNIEDGQLFLNGGIIIYTKAYVIVQDGKYVKFFTPKKKELKNIWKPKDPEVMEYEW